MMFLSCLVASSGSTGGGIKMIRTLVLAKQAHRELNQLVHPNMVRPAQGRRNGGSPTAWCLRCWPSCFLYFMCIVTLIFVQLASGLGFHDISVGHHLPASTTAGPGFGVGGFRAATTAVLNDFQTWVVLGSDACLVVWRFSPFWCCLRPLCGEQLAEIGRQSKNAYPFCINLHIVGGSRCRQV